jgi:acyl carrier protein
LEDFLRALGGFGGVEAFGANDVLVELDLDSLDLMEWVYGLAEDFDMPLDELLFEDVTASTTLREIYDLLVKIRDES